MSISCTSQSGSHKAEQIVYNPTGPIWFLDKFTRFIVKFSFKICSTCFAPASPSWFSARSKSSKRAKSVSILLRKVRSLTPCFLKLRVLKASKLSDSPKFYCCMVPSTPLINLFFSNSFFIISFVLNDILVPPVCTFYICLLSFNVTTNFSISLFDSWFSLRSMCWMCGNSLMNLLKKSSRFSFMSLRTKFTWCCFCCYIYNFFLLLFASPSVFIEN